MMTEKQFIKSQKDCADMLGMKFDEYQKYCSEVKLTPTKKNDISEYDNSILKDLGLTEKDLKLKRR